MMLFDFDFVFLSGLLLPLTGSNASGRLLSPPGSNPGPFFLFLFLAVEMLETLGLRASDIGIDGYHDSLVEMVDPALNQGHLCGSPSELSVAEAGGWPIMEPTLLAVTLRSLGKEGHFCLPGAKSQRSRRCRGALEKILGASECTGKPQCVIQ